MFWWNFPFRNMTKTDQISLTDCAYFPSYSVKCISCFILRNLMMPWNFNLQNTKTWFSWEWKELLKWNKKHLSKVYKCSLLDLKNKLAKPLIFNCIALTQLLKTRLTFLLSKIRLLLLIKLDWTENKNKQIIKFFNFCSTFIPLIET